MSAEQIAIKAPAVVVVVVVASSLPQPTATPSSSPTPLAAFADSDDDDDDDDRGVNKSGRNARAAKYTPCVFTSNALVQSAGVLSTLVSQPPQNPALHTSTSNPLGPPSPPSPKARFTSSAKASRAGAEVTSQTALRQTMRGLMDARR